jgi:uncharacterized repeat protein (TIGR01451 family)
MSRLARRRAAAAVSAASLLTLAGTALIATPAALAAPASGAYTANAASDLVHLNAVDVPGVINVADVTVAPATTAVSTATSPRVTSHATNVHAGVLGVINENLVVEALQTAPPDHTTGVHDELLSVPAAPVLTATITSADAHSRWNADDSCITDVPLSTSVSKVADLAVLPAAVGGASVVSLDNTDDPSGAAVSATTASLVKPAGQSTYAVQSSSLTEVTSLNLLGALTVDVITAPRAVALATGVAGTAKVDLTQPVIRVNGTTYLAGQDLAPIAIPAGPVLELSVGNLTKSVSANGTSASGAGNLLTLRVLDVTGTITLATLTIGDVSASATAPAGGISCGEDPLRDARKDASAATVNAGHSFDYTITVPNRGTSDLTDVKVVDTVSGTPALVLEKAVPAPTSTSGSTYTFDLGTIAPNQVKTITLTFTVPAGTEVGTAYSNKAVITATYGGGTVTKTVSTPYPTVDAAGVGPCDLSRSTKFASHLKVTPGETFTYYVNAFNQGAKACSDVVVEDSLPEGAEFVSCTHGCTHDGQDVRWAVGTLAAGASTQLAVTVRTTATSGTLPNTADLTASSGLPGSASTAGPSVGSVSVLSPSHPASRLDLGLDGNLARTGGLPLALAGAFALAVASVLRRRRLTV